MASRRFALVVLFLVGVASGQGAFDRRPNAWERHTYGGEARFEWERAGRAGRCVSIASKTGADAGWRLRLPIKPHALYRLSGWIRTEDVERTTGRGALLNVHGIGGAETRALAGTQPWTRVAVEFESGSRAHVIVNCLFGGWGLATGRAFFDDVKVELLHERDPKGPSATLDLKAGGRSAISRYIYGQFIEHMGRCIYGGIWAEMLEDRKFFHPVGSRASPWKRLGGEVGWSMTTERGVVVIGVTKRAPDAAHGIVQHELGVVAGKEYVGRLVLAGKGTVEAMLGGQRRLFAVDGELFVVHPLRFRAGASATSLSIGVRGAGKVRIKAASLMPADNIAGMRSDTLALLQELDAPIYRWPGGNFVSGYDWRDGIGPRDDRPTRKNPAWKGLESNDFGIDEFLTFCRALKTEPLVVVNTGLGSPDLSAALVERCKPHKVEWWGVGNEMYGDWQLGKVPLAQYVKRHNEHVRAMRAVDPDIKLIAVGATGAWSEGMLRHCADHMDLLSEHFYCGEQGDVARHAAQIPEAIRAKVRGHPSKIPLALDEWNYWYGEHLYGELGVRYRLKDALGIARGLHEMIRHPGRIFMANYAQTVNVIGCIKTSKTAACFATTGLPLKLYRRYFGTLALPVHGHPAPLDVVAGTAEQEITIGIVNPTDQKKRLKLTLKNGKLAARATRFVITASDATAFNEPGRPPAVEIAREERVAFDPAAIEAGALSVTLYVVKWSR